MGPGYTGFVAHFYLVSIHPFGDGNVLALPRGAETSALYKAGVGMFAVITPCNYFYRHRPECIDSLNLDQMRGETDLTPFSRRSTGRYRQLDGSPLQKRLFRGDGGNFSNPRILRARLIACAFNAGRLRELLGGGKAIAFLTASLWQKRSLSDLRLHSESRSQQDHLAGSLLREVTSKDHAT